MARFSYCLSQYDVALPNLAISTLKIFYRLLIVTAALCYINPYLLIAVVIVLWVSTKFFEQTFTIFTQCNEMVHSSKSQVYRRFNELQKALITTRAMHKQSFLFSLF